MSKCHWGDCSWFLLAVYGSIYVYGMLKKNPRLFPVSYLENEVMRIMPMFART